MDTIEALKNLGLSEKESKVLEMILRKKVVPTRDFERELDLRQPEVSMATKSLQERGWIREGEKIRLDGTGRPGNTYELAYTISEIINDLEKQAEKAQREKQLSLCALRV